MKYLFRSAFVLLCLCHLVHANETEQANIASRMKSAAIGFLETLNADQRAITVMDYDNPQRLDWHYFPKSERKGFQYRDMNPQQREQCQALLKTGLSETGYEKAIIIMILETNLHVAEKDRRTAPLRDPERFYLTIFGEPATDSRWGWSFEGHHLSLNFAIEDGKVIGDHPSFWGANPAIVHTAVEGGAPVGTRTLEDREERAFDLLNALDETQKKKAIVADQARGDHGHGGQARPPKRDLEGLPASEMNDEQQKMLWSLLEAYQSYHAPELAAARMQELKDEGIDQIHFSWMGATEPNISHGYRVQSPSFLIEFFNNQTDPAGNKANHIHTLWRSYQHDFGVAYAE